MTLGEERRIAGLPPQAQERLSDRAIQLGVAGSVRLYGYVPESDLPALLSGARALLYLSLYEGFGLPLLEGMAAGTAVLASNRTAIPEVAGDAAFYVEPEDTDAIAAALVRLLEDEPFRRELVERGGRHARNFTWEQTAHGMITAYARAIQ